MQQKHQYVRSKTDIDVLSL